MSCEKEEDRKEVEITLWLGQKGSTVEGEGGKVRAGGNGLSACQADACTVVREVDSPARGESSIAGFISKPVKVILGLTVRDDVQQTEQLPWDAAAGCHDGGEECLGTV